jgi:hypothetical protein
MHNFHSFTKRHHFGISKTFNLYILVDIINFVHNGTHSFEPIGGIILRDIYRCIFIWQEPRLLVPLFAPLFILASPVRWYDNQRRQFVPK